MARTILLTGATGNLGRLLLERVSSNGEFKVKALVRSEDNARDLQEQGVDGVVGDLEDPETLGPAFDGVDALWLLTAVGPRAPEITMNALWEARQAGVDFVLRLSAIGAAHDAPTRNGRLHALSDVDVQASGMNWTILRPHFYMQNLLGSVESIADAGAIYLNMGDGKLGMLDTRDVADMATVILTDPERHFGRIYTPTGPESINVATAAAAIGEAIDKRIDYIDVPSAAAREAMLAGGLSPWVANAYVEYGEAYASGWGDFTTGDLTEVVGHSPRSIEHFATDYAGVFASGGQT